MLTRPDMFRASASSKSYCQCMSAWTAAAWGLAGGLCVEALALYSLIRNSRTWYWRRPIPQGLAAYLISVILRVAAGAGLAAAAAGSRQVSGTFAAFGLGIAAPLVVEKLSQLIPLTGTLAVIAPPPEPKDSPIGRPEDLRMEIANPTTADAGGASDAR
jgi:hypothetical protein